MLLTEKYEVSLHQQYETDGSVGHSAASHYSRISLRIICRFLSVVCLFWYVNVIHSHIYDNKYKNSPCQHFNKNVDYANMW